MKEKVVLGHAGTTCPDAVTVDIDPRHNPDVVHDLNKVPYPFPDNVFQEVVCHHVLEHLDGIADVMKELSRICKKDGVVYIEVPHYTSWCANVPEHKLRFSYFAFDGYIKTGVTRWQLSNKLFTVLKRELTFHKFYRFLKLHRLFNKCPLMYERFFAYIFPAEHLKLWLTPVKV